MEQLQLDMGSHLFMSMAGWSYPMSRADFAASILMVRVVNATKGKDDDPFSWEWPWADAPDAEAPTDEEREQARSTLQAHSAFGHLRK